MIVSSYHPKIAMSLVERTTHNKAEGMLTHEIYVHVHAVKFILLVSSCEYQINHH